MLVVLAVSVVRAQSLSDPSLRVQSYVSGFDRPTGAVFLNDQGDLLVTQKDDGRVILVRNRQVAGTALDLPVASDSERGLLSIALSPNFAADNLVYLYHTAAREDGGEPISNKVSRYRLDGDELVFDRKIIDLPPGPGPNHDGGKIVFDAKGKLFVVIGDLNRDERTQNDETSAATTRSGAILRIQPSGNGIATNPFNAQQQVGRTRGPEADVYAYGIRNSFGIAIDPVTGNLWDTENGPDRMDEINLVRPGFNSGWKDVMGPSNLTPVEPGSLVQVGDAAHYSDPELSWSSPVAPTDLHFYEGGKLGDAYANDLFVGDVNTGSLYHFDLTSQRRSLRLTGPLEDYVVNNDGNLVDEIGDNVLGEGFGGRAALPHPANPGCRRGHDGDGIRRRGRDAARAGEHVDRRAPDRGMGVPPMRPPP
jgi:glucose/arabinose dehydrogenase